MSERPVVEVACDESGYEGEKLIATTTDVFAHASVALDVASAAEVIVELRRRIRSPAVEYKANHLLREKNRMALEWLLDADGPLRGRAHVYLIDKALFVVAKIVGLLLGAAPGPVDLESATAPPAIEPVAALYRDHRRVFTAEQWQTFLAAANDLMRLKTHSEGSTVVVTFLHSVEVLRRAGAAGHVDDLLTRLSRASAEAARLRARLVAVPPTISVVDPLIPAIVRAAAFWGSGGKMVHIVHDRQRTLPDELVAELVQVRFPSATRELSPRLAGITLVGSLSDPRVQVADFLAGVARKIASDELNDRGDPHLATMLRPYVDAHSVWFDDRWSPPGWNP